MLKDRFDRPHDYLRISLTDNCNFRCTYCIPNENISFLRQKFLMTPDEIFDISKTFVDLGVKKIRLTGGEPLIRKDFAEIISKLSLLPVQLGITTNGLLINQYIEDFIQAGMNVVNISIDSLQKEKFKTITQRDSMGRVWNNILLCEKRGLHVKLNVVVINKFNKNEVLDFVHLTKDLPLHVRFIEFMPFENNNWDKEKVVSNHLILEKIQNHFELFKLQDGNHDTDKKFGIFGHSGTISFISTLSDSFCGNCNRIRITADGKIKNCLFGKDEFDILENLRKGNDIVPIVQQAILKKHAKLGGQFEDYQHLNPNTMTNRSMIKIGG
ncbi:MULTISPECIES: GTP 3',8-cyclase MoaA [Sphingobacterium]|uniref:GTP 3',8-cyclase MoaA n=1 Tax=Sphingobacterium TaxID=28453 RepID=UPI0013DB4AFA|nr:MULTISPECIES: GTP 3',8-cyclase MoaA [unclassified Sphingobacterium]